MTNRPRTDSTLSQLAPYIGMGLQLAAAMVLFGAIGWFIDQQAGTEPWLMVAGLLIGATGGMISIIRTTIRLGRKGGSSRPSQREGG